jgi:hypothetical protein
VLPEFYVQRVKRDLGALWQYLPEGALNHDPHAYMAAEAAKPRPALAVAGAAAN